jgi:hypothetical protein
MCWPAKSYSKLPYSFEILSKCLLKLEFQPLYVHLWGKNSNVQYLQHILQIDF